MASQGAIFAVEGVVPLIFDRTLGNVGPSLADGLELVGGNTQCFRRMRIYDLCAFAIRLLGCVLYYVMLDYVHDM